MDPYNDPTTEDYSPLLEAALHIETPEEKRRNDSSIAIGRDRERVRQWQQDVNELLEVAGVINSPKRKVGWRLWRLFA